MKNYKKKYSKIFMKMNKVNKKYIHVEEISRDMSIDYSWEVNNLKGEYFEVENVRSGGNIEVDISNIDIDHDKFDSHEPLVFSPSEFEFISGLEYYMRKIENE